MTMIKGGIIVTSSGAFTGDIRIKDGKIFEIGRNLSAGDEKVIEAGGRYVLPGGVDVHTHMDLDVGIARSVDDFYTGTVAAACGGTTTIVDHMAFGPKGCPLGHQVEEYHRLADGKAVVDYGFHGVMQHTDENTFSEMEELFQEGITSFKGYLTYDYKLDDAQIYELMVKMKELGGMPAFHAENHDVITFLRKQFVEQGKTQPMYHAESRPAEMEAEAVARLLKIAHYAGDAPVYIVHLSTESGLEEIREARARGQKNIYVETCPQYLVFDESMYLREDALKYIMSPPLRKETDEKALWEGLARDEIQVVGTDHCPFHYAVEKQKGKDDFTACPNGAPGVEERMRVLYSEGVAKERISLSQFVKITAENPAKAYGLYPKKGVIQPGADADLILFNPMETEVLTKKNMRSAVDYTLYEGMQVQGRIEKVLLRGKVIVEENEFIGEKGQGEFLVRGKSR